MSKLEELIEQYCPDGVEYVKLGDFATQWYRGAGIKKDEIGQEGIPCIRYGEIHTIYKIWFDKCVSHTDETKQPSKKYADYGDILFAITSEDIPFIGNSVAYMGNERIMVGGDIVVMKHTQNPKYISYALSTIDAVSQKGKGKVKSKVVHTNVPSLKEIVIPVPPLPVQEEIVRILDAFTELQAELQAELQKRKQQYNYYLDNLLNFKNINRGGQIEVRWMKMSDIGTFYSGLSGKTKEDFQNGNAKFISYVNIFNNPSLFTDVEDRVKILEGEKQNTIQYGDLLFTGSSETPDECGMCSVLTHHTGEKLYLNSFCFGFRFNDLSGINPEFMKFLFRSSSIRKLICKTANGVTRFNISKKEFAKIVIPIPSLVEQNHIASVLDKLYSLVGDLSSGLPAEIEKRRQQYEYYRDKLLTFKRKGA